MADCHHLAKSGYHYDEPGGSGFKLMAPSPPGLFLDHPDCLCDHLYEFSVVVHPVDFNVTGGNLFECA